MGYSISGLITDHRLTDDETRALSEGITAKGETTFEGNNEGVIDLLRAADYTFGLVDVVNFDQLNLANGELITFCIDTTSGTFLLNRFVDGTRTHQLVSFEYGDEGEEGEEFKGFFDEPWEYIETLIEKRTKLRSDDWEKATFERYTL